MTLTEFLLARIAEDEHAAEMVAYMHDLDSDSWGRSGWVHPLSLEDRSAWENITVGDRVVAFAWALNYDQPVSRIAAHIARWDPARVLAECHAKRSIVELHANNSGYCRICADPMTPAGNDYSEYYPCDTLSLLAAPYASHPDYESAWAIT